MAEYKPTVYLAGPIQHVNDYGKGWRAHVREHHGGIRWVDPTEMEDPTAAAAAGKLGGTEELVEKEVCLVRQADALLVHWEEVPTCGTPMEIAYAQTAHKWEQDCRTKTFVATQTTVPAAEQSAFLSAHSDVIATTFQECVAAIKQATWAERSEKR